MLKSAFNMEATLFYVKAKFTVGALIYQMY